MLRTTELIMNSPLRNRVFRDRDLAHLFGGSAARRYGLVNKALKQNELIRLCRGIYVLAPAYLTEPHSQYYLANHLADGSFVTAESALSFHGWIPEQVTVVTSMSGTGRHREFNTPYGRFLYHVVNMPHLFLGVERVAIGSQSAWIANPVRALMDYVYWHKVKKPTIHFLVNSLRIDDEHLKHIDKKILLAMTDLYKSHYVKKLLTHWIKL